MSWELAESSKRIYAEDMLQAEWNYFTSWYLPENDGSIRRKIVIQIYSKNIEIFANNGCNWPRRKKNKSMFKGIL